MSTWIYGAACLFDASPERRLQVQQFWKAQAALYGLWVELDTPLLEDLERSIADLWPEPEWLRFTLRIEPWESSSDGFRVATRVAGYDLLQRNPSLTKQRVWIRVPQWQCLYSMLCHPEITEAYLVAEDASGDFAAAEEVHRVSVTQAIERIWVDYCLNNETDAAILFHIDLSRLPW